MDQPRRSQRATAPRLGRVFVSTLVTLTALLALGVGIYAWTTPDTQTSRGDLSATSSSVSERGTGPGGVSSDRPLALPGKVGSGSELAVGPVRTSAPTTARPVVVDDPVGVASAAIPSETETEPAMDTEDLSDIERPAAYADAEAHFRAGDYELASRYFAAYVEDRGENPWGFYMLGLSRARCDRGDAAEAAFLAALDLDPDHVKSLVNLARVRMALGRPDDALVPIERAVQLAPGDNGAHRVRARVLHNLGRSADAAQAYLSALELNGKDAWSMNNLGLIRIEAEEFSGAVPPLARAVELDSTVAVFHNNLGIALERIGDFSGAVVAFDRALGLDGSHGGAKESRDRAEALLPAQSRERLDLAVLAAEFASGISNGQAGLMATPREAQTSGSAASSRNRITTIASLPEAAGRE